MAEILTPTPARVSDASVLEVSPEERDIIQGMLSQLWSDRYELEMSQAYYESQQMMTSLGISVHPSMTKLKTVIGWPRLAVDALEERLNIDSIRSAEDDPAVTDRLTGLWSADEMRSESQLAHLEALIFGRSYVAIGGCECALGGTSCDCPPDIRTVSPLSMTIDYDDQTRTVQAALQQGQLPDGSRTLTLYTPAETLTIQVDGMSPESSGRWLVIGREEHNLGQVPVVRIANRPRAEERWGASDIVTELRSVTDAACRTLLRMSVAGEFYSTPQRYILGADESAFVGADGQTKSAWQVYIGRIMAIERDEDGQVPTVGTFPTYDPSAFTTEVDMWARIVTSITGLPPHYLGHSSDNPASAEAIRNNEARHVKKAERKQDYFSPNWRQVASLAWRHWTGDSEENVPKLTVGWRDAATPTVAAQADATVKLVQAGILPAHSEVVLTKAGLTADERRQVRAEWAREEGQRQVRAVLDRISRQAPPGQPAPTDSLSPSAEQGPVEEVSSGAHAQ